MPYKTINDLPDKIKNHLPIHAQEIFLKTFNNAFKEYPTELQAIKVAWSAVKREYKKGLDGMWHRK
jgi:cation transport regulator